MLEATPTTHEAVRGRIQIYFYGLPTLREYLLRENPLGPGRQHTRLDFMAGRLGPEVGGRVGGGAARSAGFVVGGV